MVSMFHWYQWEKSTTTFTGQDLIEVASEQCPLCGEMMIDEVFRPFIDPKEEIVL